MGKIAERLLESVLIFWVVIKYWRRKKQIARMIAYVLKYRGLSSNGSEIKYESYGLKLLDAKTLVTNLRVYSGSNLLYMYESETPTICHLGVWVLDLEFMYKDCWKDHYKVYWSADND